MELIRCGNNERRVHQRRLGLLENALVALVGRVDTDDWLALCSVGQDKRDENRLLWLCSSVLSRY